jgi:hypothetical protein
MVWLERMRVKLLPIDYYHGVFTTDHLINPLLTDNAKAIYDLLFATTWQVLVEFGRKYLKGEIGVTMVLHTWSQTMTQHVHTHCIITGGALVTEQTAAGEKSLVWRPAGSKTGERFLFPVVELSRRFRDEFCKGLERRIADGRIVLKGACASLDVANLLRRMRAKKWEVFLQKPPQGLEQNPERLLQYLGRYTQRHPEGTRMSNHRIVGMDESGVRFTWRDKRNGGEQKVMQLAGVEFIRRFLQHVLPAGFVRIRHFGLHHSRKVGSLRVVRVLLGLAAELAKAHKPSVLSWVRSLTGSDPQLCSRCGQGKLWRVGTLAPDPQAKIYHSPTQSHRLPDFQRLLTLWAACLAAALGVEMPSFAEGLYA